ncbi:uncharacterized protein PHACADRAFT_95777, partial [Phanerochaete carnosa HHB-10118-sp]
SRSPGACVHCKSLKVRCQFSPGETRCNRCIAGNHECVSRTRKKRKAAPTHDDLRARARQQDLQIQSLLAKFDELHTDAKVNKWAEQSRELEKRRGGEIADRARVYSTPRSSTYLPPLLFVSHRASRRRPLSSDSFQPFFSLLDGELHCPQRLIWRSPLLFTVICACAARHYNRQGLWALAMDIARDAAAEALIMEPVNVETVQSLLILAVYPVPKKNWLEDRSWLFMGAAIRMAQEIGLDKPQDSTDIRENLNRTRTWINACCVDGSHATQFGKMPMIKYDDYVVRTSARTWYMSLDGSPYDIGLCAYAELLLAMLKFRRTVGPMDTLPGRFREGFDVGAHCIQFDKEFTELVEFWNDRLAADPNVKICKYMIASYLRLVILSVGFQYRLKQGLSREDYILNQASAQHVIQIVLDSLYPSGLLSWAMEANFLYMAFCAGFLLNLFRPRLLPLLDASQCRDIVKLVKRLIVILGSNVVALDGRHSPALYSKFLRNLFEKYYTPALREQIDAVESPPQHSGDEDQYYPETHSWPDVPSHEPASGPHPDSQFGGRGSPVVQEQAGDNEMDFSLSHFVSSALPLANTTEPGPIWEMHTGFASPAGMYAQYSADVMQQWQYPFNHTAMLDMAST